MRLHAGLVFLSDSRTNAGVDHIGTFRKMSVYEQRDDRVMVLMTAGNLSISQSVRELLNTYTDAQGLSVWNAPNMYEAARILGETVRLVNQRDAKALSGFGILQCEPDFRWSDR
jgi:putative proteasome-type protease